MLDRSCNFGTTSFMEVMGGGEERVNILMALCNVRHYSVSGRKVKTVFDRKMKFINKREWDTKREDKVSSQEKSERKHVGEQCNKANQSLCKHTRTN